MFTFEPTLAPKARRIPRLKPKHGRGVRRNTNLPKPHRTRRNNSLRKYLVDLRFKFISSVGIFDTSEAEDRLFSLMRRLFLKNIFLKNESFPLKRKWTEVNQVASFPFQTLMVLHSKSRYLKNAIKIIMSHKKKD